ncbi:MAG TPA: P-loop NTPase fold protein [Pyrinomonadaceae bacterium]|jgi:KAP family P-loop domain.|nr:P-loop NTPase fold protein [Pyrinomonadaceae bacterium]
MPEPLRIRLRPDWDAALTYDSLHEEPENRPVFVGREILIAPLVAEIIEPNKRGTYLISGYRGTGKTTLLIEALGRAKKQLTAKQIRLFPLVLNVSEVSASLGDVSSISPMQLDIDPRRLLIALIRTIRDGIFRLPDKDDKLKELAETVNFAYEKATAAKFTRSGTSSQETTSSRAWELALALEDKNVLKTLAVITGAAAVAFEAAALIGPSIGWLHAAALALASVFAISLTASFKRSRTDKQSNSKQTALEHDNSLQQLETDLKDILASLKQNKLRTVVVMEELDKIDDPKGQQLAAVIRYFKNLFTQAPALFFFVTDKSYFDIIASAIKRARRSRSYAVEHTFFTHRIFVGRPSTEESLKFLSAIAAEEKDRKAIESVAETLGKPGRIHQADQLGRFVRVVLFNAANHLFDLKNELRRYARNEKLTINGQTSEASVFLIDEQTLPPEQAALAVFQDLIVEKSRSFEIKGGRTYANETLADSLYALFNALGSNQVQEVNSFLPTTNSESADALLLDEQLNLSEAARVREAVESLVGDLERGRAIQSREAPNTFTWRDDAARAFRYVRQLLKHEESLIAELQRHASLLNALSDPAIPHPVSTTIEKRVIELRDAPEPLTADAALDEQRQILDSYASALSAEFSNRLVQLQAYGFIFDQVAQGLGASLYLARPNSGDPRLNPAAPRGGVLLAFGESETLNNDVLSFISPTTTSLFGLDRAALVHVIHVTSTTGNEIENRRKQWNDLLSQPRTGSTFSWSVEVLPLVADKKEQKLSESQRIAASLALFGAWSRVQSRPYEWIGSEYAPMESAVEAWHKSKVDIFRIDSPPAGPLRGFGERDVLEKNGDIVLSLLDINKSHTSVFADLAISCMMKGFEQAWGGPDQWAPLGEFLVNAHRIILFVDWQHIMGWDATDLEALVREGARMILVKDGSLPEEFLGLTFLSAPPPSQHQQEAVAS